MDVFEVTVTKWVDNEGLDKKEIGKLFIRQNGNTLDGCARVEDFTFSLDEGSHPLVPRPLRSRGEVKEYPVRQSVWSLIHAAITTAIRSKLLQ